MKGNTKEFLKKKGINISAKTYFVDAMGGMAQGLFASLLVGTILTTISKYIGMIDGAFFERFAHFLSRAGAMSSAISGAAIGVGRLARSLGRKIPENRGWQGRNRGGR